MPILDGRMRGIRSIRERDFYSGESGAGPIRPFAAINWWFNRTETKGAFWDRKLERCICVGNRPLCCQSAHCVLPSRANPLNVTCWRAMPHSNTSRREM